MCFVIIIIINQYFLVICFSLLGNKIGDAGVSYIAEALKVNNTLNRIMFWSE